MNEYLDITLRLLISIILGALIGIERERRNRPAGLRTHVLVSLGSALFTITSIQFSKMYVGVDPSRVAANIVTGIGFLGAGTIMREGLTVRGLTTAATIWVSSAIGLSCGMGYYIPAIITSISTFLILILLRNLEYIKFGKFEGNKKIFNVKVTDKPGQLGKIGTIFGKYGIHIRNVKFEREENFLSIEFILNVPENIEIKDVCNELSKEEFLIEVSTE
ncbi:MAG: MgtC/SapB family protein [Caldisericia bacterium]